MEETERLRLCASIQRPHSEWNPYVTAFEILEDTQRATQQHVSFNREEALNALDPMVISRGGCQFQMSEARLYPPCGASNVSDGVQNESGSSIQGHLWYDKWTTRIE